MLNQPYLGILGALFFLSSSLFGAVWKSSDYKCQVYLPDGQPQVDHWITLGSVEPGTLVGSRKEDGSIYLFCGCVDLAKEPKVRHLDAKSIETLQKRFFGPGQGFWHGLQRITLNGMNGFRLTGDQVYSGAHYGLVVDMYEANGRIYQLAGMKQNDQQPWKDYDIKVFLASFKVLR
jgi:hypothetical protein